MSLMHHNALRTGLHWKCYPKCTLSPIPAHQGDDATSGKTSMTSSWVSDENHMKRLRRLYIRHLGCTIPVTPLSPCSLSPLNLGGKLGLGWRSRGRNRNQKKKLLFFSKFLSCRWLTWLVLFCFLLWGLWFSIIKYYRLLYRHYHSHEIKDMSISECIPSRKSSNPQKPAFRVWGTETWNCF